MWCLDGLYTIYELTDYSRLLVDFTITKILIPIRISNSVLDFELLDSYHPILAISMQTFLEAYSCRFGSEAKESIYSPGYPLIHIGYINLTNTFIFDIFFEKELLYKPEIFLFEYLNNKSNIDTNIISTHMRPTSITPAGVIPKWTVSSYSKINRFRSLPPSIFFFDIDEDESAM